jgi:hypothetical protein
MKRVPHYLTFSKPFFDAVPARRYPLPDLPASAIPVQHQSTVTAEELNAFSHFNRAL